jgi:hypothetical protein
MKTARSRNVVAQKKNYQHPFTRFYPRLFHPIFKICCKDSILFVLLNDNYFEAQKKMSGLGHNVDKNTVRPFCLNGDFCLNHDFYRIYRILKRKNHPVLENLFNLIEITVQTFFLHINHSNHFKITVQTMTARLEPCF